MPVCELTQGRRHRVTGLVPNYVVMKINCYICTTVVSLPSHARSSRDPPSSSPPSFTPFSNGNRSPPYHRLEPPFPPPLPPRHLFDSLSKVYTLPICLFRRFHPTHPPPEAASSTRFNLRLVPRCLASTINPNFTGICFKSCAFSCLAPWIWWILSTLLEHRGQRNSTIWMDPSVYARITDSIEILIFLVWKYLTLNLDEYVEMAGK